MAGGPTQDDHWFVPKPVGYGARPANARGWAAIGVHVAVLVVLAVIWAAMGFETPAGIAVFLIGTLVATAILVVVAKRKTRGEWRWRSRGEGGTGAS